jgi:hypothetical protein
MACTSSLFRPSSWAICALDRFSPIKYRHSTHVGVGGARTAPSRSGRQSACRTTCIRSAASAAPARRSRDGWPPCCRSAGSTCPLASAVGGRSRSMALR